MIRWRLIFAIALGALLGIYAADYLTTHTGNVHAQYPDFW